MIYDSLRKLPKIIQVEIWETGNVMLLDSEFSVDDEARDIAKSARLLSIWARLNEAYQKKYDKENSNKIFNINKQIDYLENKYTCIQYGLDSLYFNVNDNLIQMLAGYGYKVDMDNYDSSIEQIDRESEAILMKVKLFKKQLPEKTETEGKYTDLILSSMGAFMSILGIDFDFYDISVEKYHVIEAQVEKKIKALEKAKK